MLESHALGREVRLIDQVVGKVTNDFQLNILESLLAYVFRYTNEDTSWLGISEDRRSGRTSQSLSVRRLLVRPSEDFSGVHFSPSQSTTYCLMAAGPKLA
jgi:hypothetical protein